MAKRYVNNRFLMDIFSSHLQDIYVTNKEYEKIDKQIDKQIEIIQKQLAEFTSTLKLFNSLVDLFGSSEAVATDLYFFEGLRLGSRLAFELLQPINEE